MNYTFKCDNCCSKRSLTGVPISVGPPESMLCDRCGSTMDRDWQADAPMIDTSGCRNHSDIKPQHQVRSHWDGGKDGEQVEREFQQGIEARRRQIRNAGGQIGPMRQTHSIPAHVYHGKIRETGDKQYWDDPSNLARHKECKVDE